MVVSDIENKYSIQPTYIERDTTEVSQKRNKCSVPLSLWTHQNYRYHNITCQEVKDKKTYSVALYTVEYIQHNLHKNYEIKYSNELKLRRIRMIGFSRSCLVCGR